MNSKRYLTALQGIWTLFACSALTRAQDQQPVAVRRVSVSPAAGAKADADGNGMMSVFNGGGQQDYVITPDGTFPVGSKPVASGLNSNRDAQVMEQVRRVTSDMLNEALGCTDAEWAIIWPKIQKIQLLQAAASPSARAMPASGDLNVPTSVTEVRQRAQALQKLLNNQDASDAQIALALTSLRDARVKLSTDLLQARKELTDLLTRRQEAILFSKGILAEGL